MKQRFFYIGFIILLIVGQFSAVGELKITIDNSRWRDKETGESRYLSFLLRVKDKDGEWKEQNWTEHTIKADEIAGFICRSCDTEDIFQIRINTTKWYGGPFTFTSRLHSYEFSLFNGGFYFIQYCHDKGKEGWCLTDASRGLSYYHD